MAIEIRVHKRFSARIDRARLKRAASRALNAESKRRAASPVRRPAKTIGAQSKPGLTIYVTTDSEIRLFNRKFHGTNAATDVLSFPARWGAGTGESDTRPYLVPIRRGRRALGFRGEAPDGGAGVPPALRGKSVNSAYFLDANYLGDIVISYDRARVQARRAGWPLADELDLLTVHGVLHLLGHDDSTPRGRAQMWKQQEEILGKIIK